GTSRLPLTSVEAPLPAFSFGQLHYVNRANAQERPMTTWQDLLDRLHYPQLVESEKVKLFEFILRSVNTNSNELIRFLGAYGRTQIIPLDLWRAMFRGVSLSPHTKFTEFALICVDLGVVHEDAIDFRAHLLDQLNRHLTAYDLVTFHHRG